MVTLSDYFCGAGGSSTGLVAAGFEVKMAANHWALAIETHNTNHPTTDHYLDDLQQAHPSRFPKTDVAWFSPSCVNHSISKGKKRKNLGQLDLWGETGVDPSEERSRATMREVVEFTEYHQYQAVIVENVVDIKYWQFHDEWWNAMLNMGYAGKVVYLNSQFFGVPQSRDRYYAVFWRKGNRAPDLDFTPRAVCSRCGDVGAVQSWKKETAWGRYNRQYVYRCPMCAGEVKPPHTPASDAIDWSIVGQRIGERVHPLMPKTMERIRVGLRRFARPFTLPYANQLGPARDIGDPLHTIPTMNAIAVVTPLRGTANSFAVDEPLSTIVAAGQQHALVMSTTGNWGRDAMPVDAPLPTQTARQTAAMVVPPFISSFYGVQQFSEASNAIPTITTKDRHALVVSDGSAFDPADLIDDCSMRMLQPHELQRGMSFPDSYIILGNKRDQVRQIGNAVCCNVAELIGQRVLQSLN